MESENSWSRVTIKSLIEDGVITGHKDGNYGSKYPRLNEFGNEGVLFLTAKLLNDSGQIDFDNPQRLATEKANQLTYGFIESGDVLLSHNATIGRVAVVPELKERVLVGTSLTYYRLDSTRLLPQYLAAFFKGRDFQNQLKAVMSHTTRNQVPITSQRLLQVVLPPLYEQKIIADILGAFDNKIELNRRINETLEAMARAIFKSWFVDFDPVRAKLDGRQPPGMDAETADLFPDHFEHVGGEPVPKGWPVQRWGEIATLEYGKSLRGYKDATGPYRVFGTNGPIGWHSEPLRDSAGIIIGRKGAYRGVHYSPEPFFVIDTAFYLRPKVDFDLKWAFYELLNFDINNMDSGSAIPSTSRDDFYAIPVCVPSPDVLRAFSRTVDPLFSQKFANESQNKTLTATRDALLPKLLSGEIRVGDAEQCVEEVM